MSVESGTYSVTFGYVVWCGVAYRIGGWVPIIVGNSQVLREAILSKLLW